MKTSLKYTKRFRFVIDRSDGLNRDTSHISTVISAEILGYGRLMDMESCSKRHRQLSPKTT